MESFLGKEEAILCEVYKSALDGSTHFEATQFDQLDFQEEKNLEGPLTVGASVT